ncbi:MAG: pilus assembly protein [Caulobacteraceae bacterium]|nr:pilus assembly protein [Caulobacteraceae bacterium]
MRLRRYAPSLRAVRDQAGAAAVEFAFIAPVLCLMLAAVIDLGNVLYVRFRLDSAVSAAGDYAMINAASVTSTGGATLASNAATIVEASQGASWADTTVVVNDGPTTTITSGVASASGTASAADSCYCPTYAAGTVTWGSATTCGASCASGATAGKYVTIKASHAYSPLFSSYGIVKSGAVSASATVRTQ